MQIMNRQANQRKNQSGRSMVEILGVLAVIGVLSVGGLSAYKYTMKRHRITTTINQVALAMQSARGLELKKIDVDDLDDSGCLRNINWVMQGLDTQSCTGTSSAFMTAIGACVSVCRDDRNIWYMDISFDERQNPDDIITKSDCENILASEISKDGFLDLNDSIKNRDNTAEVEAVCNLFVPSDNADDESDSESDEGA